MSGHDDIAQRGANIFAELRAAREREPGQGEGERGTDADHIGTADTGSTAVPVPEYEDVAVSGVGDRGGAESGVHDHGGSQLGQDAGGSAESGADDHGGSQFGQGAGDGPDLPEEREERLPPVPAAGSRDADVAVDEAPIAVSVAPRELAGREHGVPGTADPDGDVSVGTPPVPLRGREFAGGAVTEGEGDERAESEEGPGDEDSPLASRDAGPAPPEGSHSEQASVVGDDSPVSERPSADSLDTTDVADPGDGAQTTRGEGMAPGAPAPVADAPTANAAGTTIATPSASPPQRAASDFGPPSEDVSPPPAAASTPARPSADFAPGAPAANAAAVTQEAEEEEPDAAEPRTPAPAEAAVGDVPDALSPPASRPLPRVMAIANQKGGVGKTTTAVNLGAALAELGYRVLVIDLDPQGNATTGLGINARNLDASMYDVMLREMPLDDCIEPTSLRNLFVAPSTIELAGAEIELVPMFSRELRLRRAIEEVKDDFDYLLIDCPPSLGLLTVNGLAAADEVAVPIQCEYYALEGLGQLLGNVQRVQAHLNRTLEVSTIIMTMYDARTRLAEQVVADVREHFGGRVCRVVVPRTVRLSEAPSFGQPITLFDPSSRGAIAYRELAREVSGGPPQRTG